MSRLIDYAAFIFDMDGLVLDTEPAYFHAWQCALSSLGYRAEADYFRSFSGYRFAHIRQKLYEQFGPDFDIQGFKAEATRNWLDHVDKYGIPIKSGVIELLDYARANDVPVGLATNSPASNAEDCLVRAGIKHRFPVIVTGDEVEQAKPAPDIFLKAAERLGVDICAALVFEDSQIGIEAASAAGAFCAYIPSVLPANLRAVALSDYVFDDLAQLFQSLAKPVPNGI